jgi:hypothetical protein
MLAGRPAAAKDKTDTFFSAEFTRSPAVNLHSTTKPQRPMTSQMITSGFNHWTQETSAEESEEDPTTESLTTALTTTPVSSPCPRACPTQGHVGIILPHGIKNRPHASRPWSTLRPRPHASSTTTRHPLWWTTTSTRRTTTDERTDQTEETTAAARMPRKLPKPPPPPAGQHKLDDECKSTNRITVSQAYKITNHYHSKIKTLHKVQNF